MFDNDWIQADFDIMDQEKLRRKIIKRRRNQEHKEKMLQQGFIPCSRCNGSGTISKEEGRVVYPRKDIRDKINRTCPVCQGKKFINPIT